MKNTETNWQVFTCGKGRSVHILHSRPLVQVAWLRCQVQHKTASMLIIRTILRQLFIVPELQIQVPCSTKKAFGPRLIMEPNLWIRLSLPES